MNKKILHIIQLETIPYLIKNHNGETFYCCKGTRLKGSIYVLSEQVLLYFNARTLQWLPSLDKKPGSTIVRKHKNLSRFLREIKSANPETQFVINGKNI